MVLYVVSEKHLLNRRYAAANPFEFRCSGDKGVACRLAS